MKHLLDLFTGAQYVNKILLGLTGIKYLTLIDARSGYHNLRCDEKSSD